MARISLREAPWSLKDQISGHEILLDAPDENSDLVITGSMEELRKTSLPCVFVTASPCEELFKEVFSHGAYDCIILPVHGSNINHRIKVVLELVDSLKACKENEKRYRAALVAIPDLILHFGEDGTLIDTYFDDDFPLIFNPKEAIGKKLTEVFDLPLCKLLEDSVKECINKQKMIELTYEANGRFREARVVHINHGMREALVLVRDVTLNTKMSQELSALRSLPMKMEKMLYLSDEIVKRTTAAFSGKDTLNII